MSNVTYTEKYTIMTNRIIFADYMGRKEINTQGHPLPLNIGRSNEASIMTAIREGAVHTPAKLGSDAIEAESQITTPNPPTSLCVIPGDSVLNILFIAGFNGNTPITNYRYSTDDITYISLNQTTSPLLITGLDNGIVYTLYLKAVNAKGESIASSSVTAAPIPSSFTPASISGINLWLDAQVRSNVILNGTEVSAWNDSAGTNNFTKNATGIIKYDRPGMNGRPSLNFITATPTPTYLQNTGLNLAPSNQLSLFMVLSQRGTGLGNSELFYTRPDYTYFDLFNVTNTTGDLSLNARNQTQRGTGSNIVNSTNNIISVVLDTTGSIYLNGSATSVSNTAFTGLSLNTPLNWTISAGAFKGYICEVITYPSSLNETNRQKVEGYLAWKWGLQASLPIGHPYKSAPPSA